MSIFNSGEGGLSESSSGLELRVDKIVLKPTGVTSYRLPAAGNSIISSGGNFRLKGINRNTSQYISYKFEGEVSSITYDGYLNDYFVIEDVGNYSGISYSFSSNLSYYPDFETRVDSLKKGAAYLYSRSSEYYICLELFYGNNCMLHNVGKNDIEFRRWYYPLLGYKYYYGPWSASDANALGCDSTICGTSDTEIAMYIWY